MFNNLVNAVEKYMPQYEDIVRDSKVFEFDRLADPIKKLSKYPWELAEEMRLPFKTVAMTFSFNPANIVLIQDIESNAKGIKVKRNVITYYEQIKTEAGDATGNMLIEGTIENCIYEVGKKGLKSLPKINNVHIIYNNEVINTNELLEKEDHREKIYHDFILDGTTAIMGILILNTPENFILERTPTKFVGKKLKKIPRYHQRSIYTILKPRAIREKLGWQEEGNAKGNHASPTAGPRRGFWRTYKDPNRYKKMLGKRQWIESTWVGKKEEVIGNHLYKVRLDI